MPSRFASQPLPPLVVPAWPVGDEGVRAALTACYESGDWGRYQGEFSTRLCHAIAQRWQREHVSLCCSGTFAVELALRGLGVGPGDEVILAGYDFPGNFRAIEATGARPVLVDVVEQGVTLSAAGIESACSAQTRACVVTHLHGMLARMDEIMPLAAARGLAVVEDACQVPGARVAGRSAGSWGDVGVLSFGGSKLLSAGRGGAILTHRPEVHQRAKVFCEQGNHAFPLSELQAAVLLPQLEQLDLRNRQRERAVARISQRLEAAGDCALQPLLAGGDGETAYYKLAFWYRATAPRDALLSWAVAAGVPLAAGFRGFVHRGPRRCRHAGPLPHSRHAAAQLLLAHHPVLLADDETLDLFADWLIHGCQRIELATPLPRNPDEIA